MPKYTPESVKAQIRAEYEAERLEHDVERGQCFCGCGARTDLWHRNDTIRRRVKGLPKKFISDHQFQYRSSFRQCQYCGGSFRTGQKRHKSYCSRKCYDIAKSTGTVTKRGYKQITVNGKQVNEHRHVMERHLGRKLLPTELVHHISGDTLDNRVENLAVMSWSAHTSLHHALSDRWAKHYERCQECGKTDRRHAGHGLCKPCYSRWQRAGFPER